MLKPMDAIEPSRENRLGTAESRMDASEAKGTTHDPAGTMENCNARVHAYIIIGHVFGSPKNEGTKEGGKAWKNRKGKAGREANAHVKDGEPCVEP